MTEKKLERLSYSRLSQFENCPKNYWYQQVAKAVPNNSTEATEYGTRVHETLELYGKAIDAGAEPATLEAIEELEDTHTEARAWLPLVRKIMSRPGRKFFEHEMAIRRDQTICAWDAEDAWLRSIADVLIVNGPKAYCLDWKTGKKRDNPTQMQVFAYMVFLHFPDVQEVVTSFIWLKVNDTTDATYTRRYMSALWMNLEPRFAAVQAAVDTGNFPAKPSGLCPWCAAKNLCPDARLKK